MEKWLQLCGILLSDGSNPLRNNKPELVVIELNTSGGFIVAMAKIISNIMGVIFATQIDFALKAQKTPPCMGKQILIGANRIAKTISSTRR